MTKFLAGKNVLLTTSHIDIGSGGSMQMLLLARGLVEAGASVDALVKQAPPGRKSQLEQLLELPVNLEAFRPNRWYSPVQIARMRRRLKARRYDIVHTHKGGDLSLVLLASTRIDLPVLVTTRGVSFPLGLNRLKYRLRKLDRVIVVSEQSRGVMKDHGVPPEKIEVIYGGVDTKRFAPGGNRDRVQKEFALPLSAPVFLVVANLVRQKGHGDYLKAAAILNRTHPNCRHLFAGSGDPEPLKKQAAELGLANHVIFAGFRSDVPDLFAASFASVFPGFAGEGVSGVLRESLACGVPVITTDVGGNAELIRHESFGLVTPRRKPEALAAAMARLLDDRPLAGRLAEQGRRFVLENHSQQARNRRVFDLYRRIARSKGLDWQASDDRERA